MNVLFHSLFGLNEDNFLMQSCVRVSLCCTYPPPNLLDERGREEGERRSPPPPRRSRLEARRGTTKKCQKITREASFLDWPPLPPSVREVESREDDRFCLHRGRDVEPIAWFSTWSSSMFRCVSSCFSLDFLALEASTSFCLISIRPFLLTRPGLKLTFTFIIQNYNNPIICRIGNNLIIVWPFWDGN